MQPAMPGRRHLGGLGDAAVNHPAALKTDGRIDFAVARAVVAIAELVVADELAVQPRPHLGAEGLAIPPGESAQQESLHRRGRPLAFGRCCLNGALMPFRDGSVQGMAAGTARATCLFLPAADSNFMLSLRHVANR